MRILVTHVTRMARGFCCVAGLAEGDHRHVRPTLGRRLGTELLAPEGQFDFGAIVDLGAVRPTPERPELEDHEFNAAAATRVGYVSAVRLWQILGQTALGTLAEIFGDELEHTGTRAFLPIGSGAASLGCYRPIGPVDLVVRDGGDHTSVRVVLPAERLDLSLTDARYFRDEFTRPDEERVRQAQDAISAGAEVLLGVGVGRPFASAEGQLAVHWLQVNALHLADNPGLRLRATAEQALD
jgi:hypothetical protein